MVIVFVVIFIVIIIVIYKARDMGDVCVCVYVCGDCRVRDVVVNTHNCVCVCVCVVRDGHSPDFFL